MAGAFFANFLQFLLMALWALVFGRMIMSWVDPTGSNSISGFLKQATEPHPRAGSPDVAPDRDDRLVGVHRADRPRLPLARVLRDLRPPEVRFAVRLTPRGGSDRVDGVVDGILRAHVGAPAVDGAANNALIRLLADQLEIPRRDVRIVAGAAGRQKLVVVDHLEPAAIVARWPGLRV